MPTSGLVTMSEIWSLDETCPRAMTRHAMPQRIMAYLAGNHRVARVMRSMLEPSVTACASVYSGVGPMGATSRSNSLWRVRMATVYLRATVVRMEFGGRRAVEAIRRQHNLPSQGSSVTSGHDNQTGVAKALVPVAVRRVRVTLEEIQTVRAVAATAPLRGGEVKV